MKFIVNGIVTGLALFLYSNGYPQQLVRLDSTRSYFFESKFQTGYILPEDSTEASLLKNNPYTLQLDFSVLKNEQRIWDYAKCYSKNGVSLSYTDFGNARNLGKALSVVVFTEPILILSKKIQFTLRAGTGISYLNKIYQAQNNPTNLFYSKNISFMLMLTPAVYYSLNDRTRLSLGAQFNHISNGGTRWPNKGMNYLTASAGIAYLLRPQALRKRKSTPFTNRSMKIVLHIFDGTHNADPTSTWPEKQRGLIGLNMGVIKPLGRVNALGVGSEVYYDGIGKVLEAQSGQKYNLIIGSISLQHYFFFGKLLFGQQLAYYVTPLNPNMSTKLYQRYILEYNIHKKWYAGVSLRSHGEISDYLSLSTGLIF